MSMKTVLLATFNELEPARRLQARLQQVGIQSTVCDESKRQRFWFMSEPRAAIHVEVVQCDFAKAGDLLHQWHRADDALKDAVRCPACHSSRVEFPQLTRKFVTPSLGVVLMAVGLIP